MLRKILLIIVSSFMLVSYANAQKLWYKTTAFAYHINDDPWSDWAPSSLLVKFDLDNDKITIFSDEVQIYRIVEEITPPYDNQGTTVAYRTLNQDNSKCIIRLRRRNDGDCQLYIDFADISWVYSVKRVS